MKTLKEMIEVMEAALEGKPIEFLRSDNDWRPINIACAVWDWYSCDYRIAPAHAPAPDEIDWSVLSDGFKYIARDECGEVFAYFEKPELSITSGVWLADECTRIDVLVKSYKRGDRPWYKSLIERPSNK